MPYLIVDCNNFYVACERAFDARLVGRPVVVLSNNDGCFISRSPEAKAVGIKMGAPAFQSRALFRRHGVAVLSSNYTLYADMSHRVMEMLNRFTDNLEVYSIDEAFLETSLSPRESVRMAREIRQLILQWTGIPVSVGVAGTKTLAKLINHLAKREPERGGIACFETEAFPDQVLAATEIEDIWGIGSRLGVRLRRCGIENALQLRQAPSPWVRQHLTITGARLQQELRGISCIPLGSISAKKTITCSRSFGRLVWDISELRGAITCFVDSAAEKLRRQQSAVGLLQVFLRTDKHRTDLLSSWFRQQPLFPSQALIRQNWLPSHIAYWKVFIHPVTATQKWASCSAIWYPNQNDNLRFLIRMPTTLLNESVSIA